VVFNVSAASVVSVIRSIIVCTVLILFQQQANVNVTANLFLNVYGMHPINTTIDICQLFQGRLCPLPLYVFNGSDTLTLPLSVKLLSQIPRIAYHIPDLQAFAQLTLTEVGTGELKACIQSTLSNGWSTHQAGVSWSIGGVALLAAFSAAWQSFLPDSIAPFRLLDLLMLYQTIASSGFFDLNYPVIYRAFTLNFSWAMGLFSQSPTSSMQRSITHMRHLTGGDLAGSSAGGSVALVNRKLSPFNRRAYVDSRSLIHAVRDVETVTSQSSNVLDAGVPIYVNTIGIATANAFMTAFFSALILLAITLTLLLLTYGVVALTSRHEYTHSPWRTNLTNVKIRFRSFARAWGLRIVSCIILRSSYP
jgi:Transient receptor potential (TRP) ion channel/ML-like domain